MADEITTADKLRIAHRRGHSLPLHERAREDTARADVLVTTNDALLEVGDLFDGEMLVVDGEQVISIPISGGGGTVEVGAGLIGDGSVLTPVEVDFGTGTNQVRHGDDAAYTNARTPLAHNQAIGTITGLGTGVDTFLATPSSANLAAALTDETGSGAVVFATSPTLVTPILGTPTSGTLTNCTGLPASGVASGTLALARMTAATAGQQLRVDSAGTSIEGYFTPIDILTGTGTTTTTTPATLLTLSLPAAGTYLIEGDFPSTVGSVTGTRNQTVTINVTNLTTMNICAEVATSAPAAASRAPITASGSSFSVGLATNQSGWIRIFGLLTVSAASSVTLDFSVAGDTGTLRGGAFVKATRKS